MLLGPLVQRPLLHKPLAHSAAPAQALPSATPVRGEPPLPDAEGALFKPPSPALPQAGVPKTLNASATIASVECRKCRIS
jgi:hypothetical protein